MSLLQLICGSACWLVSGWCSVGALLRCEGSFRIPGLTTRQCCWRQGGQERGCGSAETRFSHLVVGLGSVRCGSFFCFFSIGVCWVHARCLCSYTIVAVVCDQLTFAECQLHNEIVMEAAANAMKNQKPARGPVRLGSWPEVCLT